MIKSYAKLIPSRLEQYSDFIIEKIQSIVDYVYAWSSKYAKFPVHGSEMNHVQTLLRYYSGLIKPYESESIKQHSNMEDVL